MTLECYLAQNGGTQLDNDRNKALELSAITLGSHRKLWWRCEKGHSWQAMPFSRTKEKGSGCPYCTGKKVLVGFNDLQTLRPKLAKEWHRSLNGELEPSDVTLGSNKKVWWRCEEGHVWQAAVYSRTRARASGCPVCAGVVKTNKKSTDRKRRTMKRQSATEVSP